MGTRSSCSRPAALLQTPTHLAAHGFAVPRDAVERLSPLCLPQCHQCTDLHPLCLSCCLCLVWLCLKTCALNPSWWDGRGPNFVHPVPQLSVTLFAEGWLLGAETQAHFALAVPLVLQCHLIAVREGPGLISPQLVAANPDLVLADGCAGQGSLSVCVCMPAPCHCCAIIKPVTSCPGSHLVPSVPTPHPQRLPSWQPTLAALRCPPIPCPHGPIALSSGLLPAPHYVGFKPCSTLLGDSSSLCHSGTPLLWRQ